MKKKYTNQNVQRKPQKGVHFLRTSHIETFFFKSTKTKFCLTGKIK